LRTINKKDAGLDPIIGLTRHILVPVQIRDLDSQRHIHMYRYIVDFFFFYFH
jgi:hypothetical protein